MSAAAAAPVVTSVQRRLHSYDEAIVALNSMQESYCRDSPQDSLGIELKMTYF